MALQQLVPAVDSPADPKSEDWRVDIVAVHGLNPRGRPIDDHAYNAWTKPQEPGGHLWLRDSLPNVAPGARVFLYAYNSNLVFSQTKERFIDKANDLLEALRMERKKAVDRPIIFLAHSLGGILIEQALVNAQNNPDYLSIRRATTGLLFFGTPHGGGNRSLVALGALAARATTKLGFTEKSDIVEALKHGSIFTDVLKESFRHQLMDYRIVSFFEKSGNIVPRENAVFGLPGDRERILGIDAKHSDICRFNPSTSEDAQNLKRVLSSVEDLYEDALKNAESKKAIARDLNAKSAEFLQGFLACDYRTDLLTVPAPLDGTCQWIWEDQIFTDWLGSTSSSILWLSGNPGMGKSVFAASLAKAAPSRMKHPNLDLIYFFCSKDDSSKNNALTILKALIHQLLVMEPSLTDKILEEQNSQGPLLYNSLGSVFGIFTKLLSRERFQHVCCVIDGVDECPEALRTTLLDLLGRYCSTRPTNIFRVLVTSRPYDSIRLHMERLDSSALRCEAKEDSIMADIASYVSYEVERLSKDRKFSLEMQQMIQEKLVSGSQGIFLWTALMVQRLAKTPNRLIPKALGETPKGVSGIYEQIIAEIPEESREVAFHILTWVTYSPRPLTLTELNIVCDLQFNDTLDTTDSTDLGGIQADVTRCSPILKMRATSDEVLLVHETAREFLVQYGSASSTVPHRLAGPTDAHHQIADACLTYITLEPISRAFMQTEFDTADARPEHLRKFQRRHPFSRYAFSFWDWHLSLSDMGVETDETWRKIQTAFRGQGCRELSAQFHAHKVDRAEQSHSTEAPFVKSSLQSEKYVSGSHVLHLLSPQGLVPFLRLWITSSDNSTCDVVDGSRRTPLLLAAAHGHKEFVQLLIEAGKASICHQDSTGSSALIAASNNGRDHVVEYLLQLGDIDVNQRDADGQTSLLIASRGGHGGIVRMLLETNRADMNIRSRNGWHPVFAASVAGKEEALLHLLEKQRARDTDLDDDDWANIRDRAVNNGQVSVVREINSNYHDKATLERYGRTLLSKGFTPLTYSAAYGESRMIRYLVDEACVDINQTDGRGLAPIHSAAREGSFKGMQALLDSDGIDLQLLCKRGYAHLLGDLDSMAAEECSTRGLPMECGSEIGMYMLRILLGHVKAKDTTSREEREVKERERELQQFEKVAMGLDPDEGLPPSPTTRCPSTPRAKGCHDHMEGLVAVLNAFHSHNFSQILEDAGELERSESPGLEEEKFWNAMSDDYIHEPEDIGQSALHWAARNGHHEVVRLLLARGASPAALNAYGDTPFLKATASGHVLIAQILLDTGTVDINQRDRAGKPEALISAIENKHTEMVRLLLSKGADPNICDTAGGSTLHWAVLDGNPEIVGLLLQHGVEVNHISENIPSALIMAIEEGSEDVVRLLLARGENPNVMDEREGVTALMKAMNKHSLSIAEALLESGADPCVTAPSGDTALVVAAARGYIGIVTSILDRPGVSEQRDFTGATRGTTAVATAALYGRADIVDLLLQRGAAFDVPTFDGSTALRHATMGGFTKIVQRLLDAGADPTRENDEGSSALDHARRLARFMPQRREALELLEAAALEPRWQKQTSSRISPGQSDADAGSSSKAAGKRAMDLNDTSKAPIPESSGESSDALDGEAGKVTLELPIRSAASEAQDAASTGSAGSKPNSKISFRRALDTGLSSLKKNK